MNIKAKLFVAGLRPADNYYEILDILDQVMDVATDAERADLTAYYTTIVELCDKAEIIQFGR